MTLLRLTRTFCAFAFALLLLTFCPSPASAGTPELRAVWVDGFNDGFKSPAQCDLLLSRLRAMHANAVFVQMRKRADAYYASHYEGWAKDDLEQFDALAYLCRHAHAPGQPRLQVHAWINACAVGGNASAGSLVKVHPEWLSLSDTGADFDGEATKIDPGNPQAAEWTYRVYMDVVRHYPVDGIHLDFIRYGGTGKTLGHWGYNPVSVARYNTRYGTSGQPLWNDPRWQAWRRAQVTGLVRRVYVGATALRPKIVVSAATICWGDAPVSDAAYESKSASYTEIFAPFRDWMREGILDLNCPMAYFQIPKSESKWQGWSEFAKNHTYGRQCALGIGAYLNSPETTLALIQEAREPTASGGAASGTLLYCYNTPSGKNGQEIEGDTTLFADLPRVWSEDVPPPAMPWKEQPTHGSISGILLAGDTLTPLDGAQVTAQAAGRSVQAVAESDGNGTFAFANLPAGSYQITVEGSDRQKIFARVRPGRTALVTDITSGKNVSAMQVAGIGRQADGTSVTLGAATVTVGSGTLGDHFYIADAPGAAPLRVDMANLVPPTVAGDKVVVAGTLHHTPAGTVLTARAVRVVGMEIIRDR